MNSDVGPAHSLWLHCVHGRLAFDLQPLDMPQEAPLEWAAKSIWPPGFGQICGLPCCLDNGHLCVLQRENTFRIRLFLAEVSFAPLPDMLQIVLVPPPHGAGLRDVAGSGETPARGREAWCVILKGASARMEFLAALAESGCLTDNFNKFYVDVDSCTAIGHGACAKVFRMVDWRGEQAAVKKMNAETELQAIEREALMLIRAKGHPNIVDFRGLFRLREEEEGAIRVVLCSDLAPCGDVLSRVVKEGMMLESEARPLVKGVLKALAHIHGIGIIHRDIKAENILLRAPDFAVLADFGLATLTTDEEQMTRRCGSPGYIAPEVCVGRQYGPKVDVFGLGVVLYFILSKRMPFTKVGDDTVATMRRTVSSPLPLDEEPFIWMERSTLSVLRSFALKDAERRPDASTALEQEWFRAPQSLASVASTLRNPSDCSARRPAQLSSIAARGVANQQDGPVFRPLANPAEDDDACSCSSYGYPSSAGDSYVTARSFVSKAHSHNPRSSAGSSRLTASRDGQNRWAANSSRMGTSCVREWTASSLVPQPSSSSRSLRGTGSILADGWAAGARESAPSLCSSRGTGSVSFCGGSVSVVDSTAPTESTCFRDGALGEDQELRSGKTRRRGRRGGKARSKASMKDATAVLADEVGEEEDEHLHEEGS